MGLDFLLEWWKYFKIGCGVNCTTLNILKATELCTLSNLYLMWIISQLSCYIFKKWFWMTKTGTSNIFSTARQQISFSSTLLHLRKGTDTHWGNHFKTLLLALILLNPLSPTSNLLPSHVDSISKYVLTLSAFHQLHCHCSSPSRHLSPGLSGAINLPGSEEILQLSFSIITSGQS